MYACSASIPSMTSHEPRPRWIATEKRMVWVAVSHFGQRDKMKAKNYDKNLWASSTRNPNKNFNRKLYCMSPPFKNYSLSQSSTRNWGPKNFITCVMKGFYFMQKRYYWTLCIMYIWKNVFTIHLHMIDGTAWACYSSVGVVEKRRMGPESFSFEDTC